MSEVAGYILRISTEQWVDHVFQMAIYYTNLKRKWASGSAILFIHKTQTGDALVGYGVFDRIVGTDALCEKEKLECERRGWERVIEFRYVKRFQKPLPVKATFLKNSRLRGRLFHGAELDREQLDKIVAQAGEAPLHQKS